MQGHAQTPAFELIEACFAETRRARQQARAIRRKTSSRSLQKGHYSDSAPFTTRDALTEDTRSEEDLTYGIQPDAPPPGEYEVQPQRRPTGPSLSSDVSARRRDGLVSESPQIEPGKSGVEILLKHFANQVARWRQTDRRNPPPVEFAAQLKAKYLDQDLKNLPVSKMSHIARKAISLEVAKIAKLPAQRPNDSSKGVSSPTMKKSAESTLQPDAHAQKTGIVGQLDETDSAPQLQQQLASVNGLKFTELLAMCETQQTTLQHMMRS